jgi:FkbM family methyltransferase
VLGFRFGIMLDLSTESHRMIVHMRAVAKRTLKRAGQLLGFDVRWYIPRPEHALSTLLELYKVDAIFDIGANIGMSGEYFRNIGFKQKIVSFEPVSRFYHRLEQKAKKDRLWFCENAAVGDSEGEMEINVSGASGGASSFLEMTDTIKENAPELCFTGREKVKVKTVDSLIDRYHPEGDRLFLKLDVQGYEKKVLEGARKSLHRIVGMKIEMSVVRSYEQEPLIYDMLPYLYSLGFRLNGIEAAWSNQVTQELYQVDGFLFRPDRL